MISFKWMHPEGGVKVEGGDGTNGTTATLLTEANQSFRDAFLKWMNSENSQNVKYKEYQAIERQAKDMVAWIMEQRVELPDDNAKMRETLERVESSLEAAINLYRDQHDVVNYEPIRGIIESIASCNTPDGLDPKNIDIQGVFTGLHGLDLTERDIMVFRDFFLKLMKKSPETQAQMLWYFELMRDYTVSKSNNISLHTNPLKNLLFKETGISYKDWILRIFANFEKDEAWMVALAEAIRNAEAPKMTSKQFIKYMFDEKSDVMEAEEVDWLRGYYEKYGDDNVDIKRLDAGDVKRRNDIAKKYITEHSEMGKTTPRAVAMAQEFRDFTWF